MAFLPLSLMLGTPAEPSFLQTCYCSRFYTVVFESIFWQLDAHLKNKNLLQQLKTFSNLVNTCPYSQQICSYLAAAPSFIRSQVTTLAYHRAWNNTVFSQQSSLAQHRTVTWLLVISEPKQIELLSVKRAVGLLNKKNPTLFSAPTQDEVQQAFFLMRTREWWMRTSWGLSFLNRPPQWPTTSTPSLFQGSWLHDSYWSNHFAIASFHTWFKLSHKCIAQARSQN